MSTYKAVKNIEEDLLGGDVTVTANVDQTTQATLTSIEQVSDVRALALRAGTTYTPLPMTGHRTGIATTQQSIAFNHPADEAYVHFVNDADIYVVSTSANDATGNSGARQVDMTGRDSAGARWSVTGQSLSGQTAVMVASGVSVDTMVVTTAGNNGGGNEGTVSAMLNDNHTAGVPNTPSEVFAHMDPGRNQSDVAVASVPDGANYYPVRLTATTTAAAVITVKAIATPNAINRGIPITMFEATFDGSMEADLTHLGPYTKAFIHVLGKAVSGTVDMSFSLSGYTDE